MSKRILLVDRGTVAQAYFSSMLASNFLKKENNKIFVITEQSLSSKVLKIYMRHDFKSFINCFKYSIIFFFINFNLFIKSFFLLIKNLVFLQIKGFEWFKLNFKIKNIYIGDLFHDTNNRYHLRFINKKIDLYLVNILFKSIFRTLKIIDIIKKKKINLIISHHSGYAYIGSLSVRIGVKFGIKVLESKASSFIQWDQNKILNGFHNLISNGLNKKKLKHYSYKVKKKKLISFIHKRFKNKTSSNYTGPENLLFGNIAKKKITRNQLLNKICKSEKINKIVLIAPHAFSDASHVLGTKFIFQDYYNHLFETLNFIKNKKISNILWVVRPHPSSKRYGEVGIVENLVKQIDYDFIKLCPKKISTKNLVNICDNVITGRGTIGLEFACFGKYSLNSGSSAYSGLNVSLDFSNKKKYFFNLENISKIKKLSKNQTLLAMAALHYLEKDSILWRDIMKYNEGSKIFQKKNFNHESSNFYKKINEELKINLKLNKLI